MASSGKPVVALALPGTTAQVMFRDEDLALLTEVAAVTEAVGQRHSEPFARNLSRARVAITGWGSPRFDAEVLAMAPRLEMVAHSAGSVRGIISESLFDRGIRVTSSAAANAAPVAEFTVAAMVMLLKQVPWIAQAHKEGDRTAKDRYRPLLRELRDMDVGLVGASRVGREVIRLLGSYPRLRIKVFDPHLGEKQARQLGVEQATLEEVCRCEVVSIHAPALPSTRHMFNARTLALLPDHAVLINTSRGALIDEAALYAEASKRPIYVLLDVTDPEPMRPDSPLRTLPNVILTPHIAGAMNQARKDMGRLAIEEAMRFLRGEPLRHEVTREMLEVVA